MVSIRIAEREDIQLLTDMGRKTFIEAFEHLNQPIPFQTYLNQYHVVEVIEQEFNEPRNRFYIAEADGEFAGFCKLVLDEDEQHPALVGQKCMEMERIYVLKQYQGMKVGYQLLNKADEIGRQLNYDILWLGVWEKNTKAIEIYKHWGFMEFGQHSFNLGGDIQTDLMMKKSLTL